MLALVAAVETFVVCHPLDFSDPVSLCWSLSARAAARETAEGSILCVGDSLVKHAVIPRVLEARLGRPAGNFAIARGPAPATYFLLRRALEAGARPAAVVVDYKPGVLVGSPRYNLRYWQEIATPRECLDLARDAGGSLLAEIATGRLLASFRSRLEIRGALLAALRGEASPMHAINRVCRRNWEVNQGANVGAKNPSYTGSVSPEQHKTLLSHLWYCHRVNAAYVRRLLDLSAGRNVPVYWLLPPISPELQARREDSGAEAKYLKFVRSFQATYPGLTIVDGRHSSYPHTVFVDPTHLDGRGATTLSLDLAAILRRDLAGQASSTRWVELPAYRDLATPVPLEDVEQSRLLAKSSP